VLGDVPVLGFFFRDQQKSETKTELVLLITPHVLSAPEEGEGVTRRRVTELTDHPNGLDVYLDNLDKERRDTGKKPPQGAPAVPPASSAPAPALSGLELSFVELMQVASQQVRKPLLVRQPQGSVRPEVLKADGPVPVFVNPGVVTTPVAAWSNGFHYVTALKVENRTATPQLLDVNRIHGDWRAATLEQQQLEPEGEDGQSTYLYLISDVPFGKPLFKEAP
jgi:general secretion pathway protein D